MTVKAILIPKVPIRMAFDRLFQFFNAVDLSFLNTKKVMQNKIFEAFTIFNSKQYTMKEILSINPKTSGVLKLRVKERFVSLKSIS